MLLSQVKDKKDNASSLNNQKKDMESQLDFVNSELDILGATSQDIVQKIDKDIDRLGFVNGKSFSSDHNVRELDENIKKMKDQKKLLWDRMMDMVFDGKEKQG